MIRMPARRRRRLPLTPLIDVIFLLLLFFMLSSTFLRFNEVEVASAGAAQGGASTGTAALLKLAGDGTLALNGERLTQDALVGALDALSAGGTTRLVLTAETGSAVQDLVDVLALLEAGPMPVILAGGAAPAAASSAAAGGNPGAPAPGAEARP
ncbi:biopolymer transporter ExbD [Acuticoccus sp. I52.16.1]|uniref:biopolymer transporter ExbD n=1 Tax=Acuticoccus sp. I52.16.1 TaxID=2928472 RepID=UPI001FD13B6B|nr:biopolymer transporter ExbD [Acuticoccus sp. I52.16.1]UOM37301.1 biopolymer transporter ExbD [Acuticoccus sp. I52.16.1]